MLCQGRYILTPFAQGGNHKRHHVQTVVKVFAESPLSNFPLEIARGRRYDPDVNADLTAAAYAHESLISEHSQDPRLGRQRHVGNFVEIQRASVGHFQKAWADQVAILPQGQKAIVTSLRWPDGHPYQPVPGLAYKGINPWRYNSSNPTNNPGTYDLWVDVIIDGKTNRFGNWSKEPVLVNKP